MYIGMECESLQSSGTSLDSNPKPQNGTVKGPVQDEQVTVANQGASNSQNPNGHNNLNVQRKYTKLVKKLAMTNLNRKNQPQMTVNGLGAIPKNNRHYSRMNSITEDGIVGDDVIVSIDGEIETNYPGYDFKEDTMDTPEVKKVRWAVAVLSILSLTPFLLLIIHLVVLFGPIK